MIKAFFVCHVHYWTLAIKLAESLLPTTLAKSVELVPKTNRKIHHFHPFSENLDRF
jgi:hypothetical protein